MPLVMWLFKLVTITLHAGHEPGRLISICNGHTVIKRLTPSLPGTYPRTDHAYM